MQQYLHIKVEYPDILLLFRTEDFYEVFYEDARRVAKGIVDRKFVRFITPGTITDRVRVRQTVLQTNPPA